MSEDFSMVQGDTAVLTIPVVDEDGNALDISTATRIDFTLVNSQYADVLTKSLSDGIDVDAQGVTVTLDPADTLALRGKYSHELQVIDAANNVFTPLQGKVTIKRGYTA